MLKIGSVGEVLLKAKSSQSGDDIRIYSVS